MNEGRNIKDQLELIPNCGLLKHHCCFPKCPDFLVNLATEKDKIMNTRRGLWRHLRFLQMPNHEYYLKAFHRNSYKLLQRDSNNKQQFKLKMKQIYKNYARASNDHYDKTYDATFDSFKTK